MSPELKEALEILSYTVLRLIQNDSHSWSNRPCETCRTISNIIDKPFGCYEYQRTKIKANYP